MRPISQSKPQRQRCIDLYITTRSMDGDQPNPGKKTVATGEEVPLPKQTRQDRWRRAPPASPQGQATADPAAHQQRKLRERYVLNRFAEHGSDYWICL